MAINDQTTDFGTDINLVTDLAPVWGLVAGQANLINALLRRLVTPRNGLFYDPNYGFDVVALLNSAVTQVDVARIKAGIGAELRKDQRVLSLTVDVVFTFATKTMRIAISVNTAEGPFDLVLAASAVTVELLSVNGVTVTPAATPDNTNVIVGPVGPAGVGIQGPPGASGGGGSAALEFDDARLLATSTGAEEVLYQWDGADFGALAAGSLTAELSASVLSASGTATYRLRIGGSDGVADGTVVATFTHAVAAFQAKTGTSTFTNPTGNLFVKVTAQSSGAGVDAKIKGPVVTFR